MGKQAAESHLNEDAVKTKTRKRGIKYIAVSDGASESFASRRWARILVKQFVQNRCVDKVWLAKAIAEYNKDFDRNEMSWSAQAAFDRGSFATLLGVKIQGNKASIIVVGDSFVVLDNGSKILKTLPYTESEQFRENPLLLSTIQDRNTEVFAKIHKEPKVYLVNKSKLYCMTDALGAWLLADKSARMEKLRNLNRKDDFVDMVEQARAEGTMRRDDTTLVIIGHAEG
jgi:hypothetical protein